MWLGMNPSKTLKRPPQPGDITLAGALIEYIWTAAEWQTEFTQADMMEATGASQPLVSRAVTKVLLPMKLIEQIGVQGQQKIYRLTGQALVR